MAAHVSWAATPDRTARTAAARAAQLDRFEREADPDGTMSPRERARRAEHLRKAYFSKLALRSAQARRRARSVRETANEQATQRLRTAQERADTLDAVAAAAERELAAAEQAAERTAGGAA